MISFLTAIGAIIILDLGWMGLVASSFYKERLGHLLRLGPDGGLAPDWTALPGIYVLLALGIQFLVMPRAAEGAATVSGLGALLGLVVYGVYEFTNRALLRDWPWSIVLVDSLWGLVLGALASLACFKVTTN